VSTGAECAARFQPGLRVAAGDEYGERDGAHIRIVMGQDQSTFELMLARMKETLLQIPESSRLPPPLLPHALRLHEIPPIVAARSGEAPWAPSYRTATSDVLVPGLHRGTCYGTETNGTCVGDKVWPTLAVYPAVEEVEAASSVAPTFPLLSFSHGDFGGGDALNASYLDLPAPSPRMASWSSPTHRAAPRVATLNRGPAAGARLGAPAAGRQHRVHAPRAAQDRPDPVLCSRCGHSMGGRSSLESAAVVVAHRIGAAIGIHPDPEISAANRVGAPFLLLTGTADHVEPTGSARADFDALTALPASQRAFASFVN